MLGLGNGLIKGGGANVLSLTDTYTSDFTSNTDGWAAYSSTDLTLSNNQTIDSSSGWLKGTYGATQTNVSGITKSLGWATSAGDMIIWSYKIHIVNDGGKWDPEGDSDGVMQYTTFGVNNSLITTTLDSTTTNSSTAYLASGMGDQTMIIKFQTADDLPQEDAVFYVKDFSLEWWS